MNGNGSPISISIFLELLSESSKLNPNTNTNGLISTMDDVILVKETETEMSDFFLTQELGRIEAITMK